MDPRTMYFQIAGARRMLRAILGFVGLVSLSFGVLILLIPWILQFLIGGTFIFIGFVLLGFAWRRRRAPQPPIEPGQEPDVIDQWR